MMVKPGLKLNLGCGKYIKKGYVNCDIKKCPGVDKVFDCSNLASFGDNTVDLIFCHSFFEHLYIYQHLPFLEDCKRILTKSGRLIILGIPDFEMICKSYLRMCEAPAPFDGTFDLYHAYRLTHGDFIENESACIPQLHKTLFDKKYLSEIIKYVFSGNCYLFSHNFPNEQFNATLGVVAGRDHSLAGVSMVKVLSEFDSSFDDLNSICEF